MNSDDPLIRRSSLPTFCGQAIPATVIGELNQDDALLSDNASVSLMTPGASLVSILPSPAENSTEIEAKNASLRQMFSNIDDYVLLAKKVTANDRKVLGRVPRYDQAAIVNLMVKFVDSDLTQSKASQLSALLAQDTGSDCEIVAKTLRNRTSLAALVKSHLNVSLKKKLRDDHGVADLDAFLAGVTWDSFADINSVHRPFYIDVVAAIAAALQHKDSIFRALDLACRGVGLLSTIPPPVRMRRTREEMLNDDRSSDSEDPRRQRPRTPAAGYNGGRRARTQPVGAAPVRRSTRARRLTTVAKTSSPALLPRPALSGVGLLDASCMFPPPSPLPAAPNAPIPPAYQQKEEEQNFSDVELCLSTPFDDQEVGWLEHLTTGLAAEASTATADSACPEKCEFMGESPQPFWERNYSLPYN